MSEIPTGIKPEAPGSRLKALWKKVIGKHENPQLNAVDNLTSQKQPELLPSILEVNTITPEQNQIEPPVETKDAADILIEEIINEEGVSTENEESLKPANKIFFHTTVTQNLPSIIQHGIISTKDTDIIGRDLFYSLTFAQEFHAPYVGRTILSKGQVSDFTLTIWKNSVDIRQVKKDNKLKKGQFGVAGTLTAKDEIPSGYLESRGGGQWTTRVDRTNVRRINPAEFIAAIPINESTQFLLAKCKLEFAYNLSSTEVIEQRMTEFFSNPDNRVQFGQGYSAPELAHDLAARIEQEVLLHFTGIVAKNVLKSINNGNPSLPNIQAELAELQTKALAVNEPIGQRYLSIWLSRCQKALAEHNIQLTTPKDKTSVNRSFLDKEGVDINKLWDTYDGYALVYRVAKKIGIRYF